TAYRELVAISVPFRLFSAFCGKPVNLRRNPITFTFFTTGVICDGRLVEDHCDATACRLPDYQFDGNRGRGAGGGGGAAAGGECDEAAAGAGVARVAAAEGGRRVALSRRQSTRRCRAAASA